MTKNTDRKEIKKMTKQEMMEKMVAAGYHLMGHTIDWYIENFDEATIKRFMENFMNWKKENA